MPKHPEHTSLASLFEALKKAGDSMTVAEFIDGLYMGDYRSGPAQKMGVALFHESFLEHCQGCRKNETEVDIPNDWDYPGLCWDCIDEAREREAEDADIARSYRASIL